MKKISLLFCVLLMATAAMAASRNLSPSLVARSQSEAQVEDRRAEALKKYLEAHRLEQAGNYPGAVAAFKEAIELDPKSADLRVALGALYLKNRNVIDAEAQASEAAQLAPENIDVRKLLARIYIAQSFVGSTVVKEKALAAIAELEKIVARDAQAKIEVGDQPLPALAVIGEMYLSLEDEDKALDALKRVSEGDAGADRAHFRLAQVYFQKNKVREAAGAARKAYDINREQPQYAGLLARSLQRLGRTQEAIDIYKQAIGLKDEEETEEGAAALGIDALTRSPLLFDYLEALVSAGQYDEAMKRLEPVLKAVRRDTPFYLNAVNIYADALRRSGRREEAAQKLEEALEGQDVLESLSVLYSLAETYEEMHKFDKAVETYEEALGALVNPDGSVTGRQQDRQNAALILRRIALAYRMGGEADKVPGTFERMRQVMGPDNSLTDQFIIGLLLDEGQNKEALTRATDAAARFPDERAFKLYKAQAAARVGDLTTANQVLKEELKGSGEDADVYLFEASIMLEANKLKEAEAAVRKAVDLEPEDINPLITLSIVQDRQRKHKESEATLRKALEINPDNATVLNNLGYFLTERGERLKEAEELIRRAVNIEPTNGSFLDSLGWLLFKQGKLDEAQRYIERAISYSPRSATIHDHLGDIYKKQGKTDVARQKWEEALKLATEPDEIKSIREKLNKK